MVSFLHEVAHTQVDSIMKKGVIRGESSKGKRSKKYRCEDHGVEFYNAYRTILECAERLKILEFPGGAGKFSVPSLQRFDQLDMQSVVLSNVKINSRPQAAAADQTDVRIAVSYMGKTKPLVINKANVNTDDLKKMIKSKMMAKGKFCLMLADKDQELTNPMEQLHSDCLITLAKL